jgi:hypothetical protein
VNTFSSAAITVIGLAVGAACNTPTPSLHLLLAGPPAQACPSVDCAGVTMKCPTVMSIKIMDPGDPDHPYVSQCVQISPNRKQDMCAIASVDLDPVAIPVRDLEVQVALYPASSIQADANNKLLCPDHVSYASATGFPIEQWPAPALGGNAYYHPGDDTVAVTLGCTDLDAINDSCAAPLVSVVATVESFETGLLVGSSSAGVDQLAVSVGEPHSIGDRYVLYASDIHPLRWQAGSNGSSWSDNLAMGFTKYSCVEVLETVAQSTATVTCRPAPASGDIKLLGEWVQKKQLDAILSALDPPEFPAAGLTIGMVLDEIGNPVAGATVSAKQGSVMYLSGDRTGLIKDSTSAAGIFVSTTAPFGTEFSTSTGPGQPVITGIGGQVAGRVTVVVLRRNGPGQ